MNIINISTKLKMMLVIMETRRKVYSCGKTEDSLYWPLRVIWPLKHLGSKSGECILYIRTCYAAILDWLLLILTLLCHFFFPLHF